MENFLSRIRKKIRDIISKILNAGISANKLMYSSTDHRKFLEWIRANNYRIEMLEVSSIWEAGFLIIPGSATCVKAILIDRQGGRIGAYLLTGLGFPAHLMKTKFVGSKEIVFVEPLILDKDGEIIQETKS